MTTRRQRRQMKDYLVDRLINCGEIIEPKTKEIVSGILTNYIKVGENGIILLVDQLYPNKALDELYKKARKQLENVGIVFYKDGKNFFRSAVEKNYYKMKKNLSLKEYSDDDLHKIILFRPEESFAYIVKGKKLQYYQPISDRLPEGLVTFKFDSVIFNYNHIDPRHRFKPNDTDSKKLHIWINRDFCKGKLRLENRIPNKGILKERKNEK